MPRKNPQNLDILMQFWAEKQKNQGQLKISQRELNAKRRELREMLIYLESLPMKRSR